MTIRALTLCMVYSKTHILLGLKKRGFGQGYWNGFGGKVNPGESIEDAARRECQEEAGIDLLDTKKRGILRFTFENDPEMLEGHLFSATRFSGIPHETEEMRPEWFPHDKIPYDLMWRDDPYWLPLILKGKNIEGRFHFADRKTLLLHDVRELVTLS